MMTARYNYRAAMAKGPHSYGRYTYDAIYCRIPPFPCDSTAFLYFLELGLGGP